MCTSRAPASRIICTILTEVVPRTMRVVDQHDALAVDHRAVGAVLEPHAKGADVLRRLDEGAADIVVADDAELVRDARRLRVADRRRHAGIGHRHDDVGVGRGLAGELRAACVLRTS